VVGDHVEHDLDPLRVRIVDELLERATVADVLVHRVEVGRAVAVVVGDGLVVVRLLAIDARCCCRRSG
jgi:hypothetical protein